MKRRWGYNLKETAQGLKPRAVARCRAWLPRLNLLFPLTCGGGGQPDLPRQGVKAWRLQVQEQGSQIRLHR